MGRALNGFFLVWYLVFTTFGSFQRGFSSRLTEAVIIAGKRTANAPQLRTRISLHLLKRIKIVNNITIYVILQHSRLMATCFAKSVLLASSQSFSVNAIRRSI